MIANDLMNNSEFPLHQQKSNLELSAAECVFLEIKKSTGYPSAKLRWAQSCVQRCSGACITWNSATAA